ncbi:hypothetical protein EON65_43385 [archaeon]|nr:MAG: hypothetical protein EON65_43385 [archaeon]
MEGSDMMPPPSCLKSSLKTPNTKQPNHVTISETEDVAAADESDLPDEGFNTWTDKDSHGNALPKALPLTPMVTPKKEKDEEHDSFQSPHTTSSYKTAREGHSMIQEEDNEEETRGDQPPSTPMADIFTLDNSVIEETTPAPKTSKASSGVPNTVTKKKTSHLPTKGAVSTRKEERAAIPQQPHLEVAQKFESNIRTWTPLASAPASKKGATPKKTPAKAVFGLDLSPVRTNKSTDGRPSLGTMERQWDFMRNNFVGGNTEELDWLMVSKRPGAYDYAHKKYTLAEDKYFKALYDSEFYNQEREKFGGGNRLASLLQSLAGLYNAMTASENDVKLQETASKHHNDLKTFITQNSPLSSYFKSFEPKEASSLEATLLTVLTEENKMKVVRKARLILPIYNAEVAKLKGLIEKASKDCEVYESQMEKWKKREEGTDEYPAVMKQLENEFLSKEEDKNYEARDKMRTFIPVNIQDISVQDLMQQSRETGGLLSFELATEIKQNKLLHWIVTHPEDIAMANFLTGEHKAYFENIDTLDIIELRAIVAVLPDKFELDKVCVCVWRLPVDYVQVYVYVYASTSTHHTLYCSLVSLSRTDAKKLGALE